MWKSYTSSIQIHFAIYYFTFELKLNGIISVSRMASLNSFSTGYVETLVGNLYKFVNESFLLVKPNFFVTISLLIHTIIQSE